MNTNSIDTKTNLGWRDSVYIWLLLFLVQIFIFSILVVYFLQITGWNFNELYLFFGFYGSTIGVWLGILVTEIGTLLISFGYLKIIKKEYQDTQEILGSKKFNLNNNLLGILNVPVIFFVGSFISYFQSFFFYDPSESYIYNIIYRPKNFWEIIIWIVIMLTIVGPSEEIVFRGIIQKGFQTSLKEIEKPEWYAIFLSSLLFTIFHVNLFKFIPIFFMGLILGLVFLYTDSSLVCALTHGVYDSITVIFMFIL